MNAHRRYRINDLFSGYRQRFMNTLYFTLIISVDAYLLLVRLMYARIMCMDTYNFPFRTVIKQGRMLP